MSVSFFIMNACFEEYALLRTIQSIHSPYLLTAGKVEPSSKQSFSLLYRILFFKMLVFNVLTTSTFHVKYKQIYLFLK